MGITDGLDMEFISKRFGLNPPTLVTNLAMSLVGSHYLTGGYGAAPGRQNGSSGRPGSIDLLECLEPKQNESLGIHAATSEILGHNVCAGGTPLLSGTRRANKNDADLITYLAGLKGKKWQDWGEYFGSYTPREVFVKGKSGGLYWGETCYAQQHFDCIGFVNYCFEKAGVVQHCSYSIPLWIGATVEVKEPQPGDLLIKYTGPEQHQHIGIVGDNNYIIQAADTYSGVHANSAVEKPGKFFTHLRRLRAWA